jgi:aminopeptidase-like protein
MMSLASQLYPINRSLTGQGVRTSLEVLQKIVPEIEIFETPSGTAVFDWKIPREWNVVEAYVEDLSTNTRVIDFQKSNLHLVGYSVPVDIIIERDELEDHLHSIPELPNAIPYVTSYYKEAWGFCLSHNEREALSKGPFRVVIRSSLTNGHMTSAELVIPGELQEEILISTYICHPSMANNEISGPTIWIYLAKLLKSRRNKFTYRFYIGPETIGALNYIYMRREVLSSIMCGWVVTCIGDKGPYSYLCSRNGDTLADRIGIAVIRSIENGNNSRIYSFLDRGSDERQFCAPGVDLPVGSFMRSKYGTYKEYHTSLDDLSLFSESSLSDSLNMLLLAIETVEMNCFPKALTIGEPFMSKYGLRSTLSTRDSHLQVKNLMNALAYMDGSYDLIDVADKTGLSISEVIDSFRLLQGAGIVRGCDEAEV